MKVVEKRLPEEPIKTFNRIAKQYGIRLQTDFRRRYIERWFLFWLPTKDVWKPVGSASFEIFLTNPSENILETFYEIAELYESKIEGAEIVFNIYKYL